MVGVSVDDVPICSGISPPDTARAIVKDVKDQKLKKVQQSCASEAIVVR